MCTLDRGMYCVCIVSTLTVWLNGDTYSMMKIDYNLSIWSNMTVKLQLWLISLLVFNINMTDKTPLTLMREKYG